MVTAKSFGLSLISLSIYSDKMSYKRGFAECFLSILLACQGIKPSPFSVHFQKTDCKTTLPFVNSSLRTWQGSVILYSGAPSQGIPPSTSLLPVSRDSLCCNSRCEQQSLSGDVCPTMIRRNFDHAWRTALDLGPGIKRRPERHIPISSRAKLQRSSTPHFTPHTSHQDAGQL